MSNFSSHIRRHAERTAQLWLQKLRDSPSPKRLNLIYLANGTINPNLSTLPAPTNGLSRGRTAIARTTQGRFPHCLLARESLTQYHQAQTNHNQIIAEATATAYKGASNDIQQKIRRVVEVWRQRSIFELPIQEAVEARVDGKNDGPEALGSLRL